jgi:hypothetical protein
MARFLNLIQDRAPSKAHELDHNQASLDRPEWGRSIGVAMVVVSSALRLLSDLRLLGSGNRQPRSVALKAGLAFAAGTVLGLAAPPVVRAMRRSPASVRVAVDDAIDRDSADSFPASDAPQRGR